jgi:hypothetical protein
MQISIIDFIHDPHPRSFDGTPEEVEQFLRERFRSFADGVPAGDLFELCKEIARSPYIQIVFGDERPQPKPHLHPKKKRFHEDPWIREADFEGHVIESAEDDKEDDS